MGYPIQDPVIDSKAREMRAAGGSISGIARELGIGVNRVRRICGLPLPPSQRPSGQKRYVRVADRAAENTPTNRTAVKSIAIPLTESAYERLAAIADTAYLSPEAFAATLLASYLSYQPDKIVLEPSEPVENEDEDEDEDEDAGDEEEAAEDEEEDDAEEPPPPPKPKKQKATKPEPPAEPKPEEDREPEDPKPDYSYIKPGRNLVLTEGEEESLVWVSQILARGGVVKGPADKVRVKRKDGVLVDVLAAELDPVPEDD